MRPTTRLAVIGAGALAGLAALAGPAAAHVGTEPSTVAAGKSAVVRFKIGHGCDGSPTTKVVMQIPDGVTSVKPEVAVGWQITTTTDTAAGSGGGAATAVKEITWSGGKLLDSQVQLLGVSLTMPDTPGETVYFKTVQSCESGEERWIELPGPDGKEPEAPAPGVKLTAAAANGSTDGDEDAAVVGSSDDDGGTDGVAIAGVVLGAAGLAAGGAALVAGRRKPAPPVG
jgi:uncharacterized protein YcnI